MNEVDILKFDLPLPDKKKLDKLHKAKRESRKIERVKIPEIERKIKGIDGLIPDVENEIKHLGRKVNVLPEIYQDRYDDKVNELKELQGLRDKQIKELRKHKDKVLNSITFEPMEEDVYIPYFIELVNHFTDVLKASYNDKSNDVDRKLEYNERLDDIYKLFINPGILNKYYNKVFGNTIINKGRSFYKFEDIPEDESKN